MDEKLNKEINQIREVFLEMTEKYPQYTEADFGFSIEMSSNPWTVIYNKALFDGFEEIIKERLSKIRIEE